MRRPPGKARAAAAPGAQHLQAQVGERGVGPQNGVPRAQKEPQPLGREWGGPGRREARGTTHWAHRELRQAQSVSCKGLDGLGHSTSSVIWGLEAACTMLEWRDVAVGQENCIYQSKWQGRRGPLAQGMNDLPPFSCPPIAWGAAYKLNTRTARGLVHSITGSPSGQSSGEGGRDSRRFKGECSARKVLSKRLSTGMNPPPTGYCALLCKRLNIHGETTQIASLNGPIGEGAPTPIRLTQLLSCFTLKSLPSPPRNIHLAPNPLSVHF